MRMFFRWSLAAALSVAVVVAVSMGSMVRAEVPEVVKHIPDNAVMFVAAPSLAGVSGDLAMLNETLGLNQPEMANLLGMLKGMTGVNEGLRDNGGGAMVLTSVPDPNGGQEPDMYILIPTDNYAALVGNFGVTDVDPAGVTLVEIQGEQVFMKKAGNFAVAAPKQELIDAYAATDGSGFEKRSGAFASSVFTGSDILVYVDIEKFAPLVMPMMTMGMRQAQQQMAMADPMTAEMAGPFIKLYGDVMQATLRDGQSVVIGLDVDSAGVGFATSVKFKDGSTMANAFKAPPSAGVSLDRLPTRPYIMASVMNLSQMPVAEWKKAMGEVFPADSDMGKLMAISLDSFKDATGDIQSALYPAFGPLPVAQVGVYEAADPAALRASTIETYRALNGLSIMPGTSYKVTVLPNAREIGGKSVDQFTIGMDMPGGMPPEMAGNPMFNMLMNQQGFLASTDSSMVYMTGADTQLFGAVLETADGGGNLGGNAGITAVRAKLQPDRFAEGYFSLQGLVQTIQPFVAMFMPQIDLTIADDIKPIGFSMSASGGSAGERVYIPMEVITTITTKAHQIQQQMNGGGNGGPGVSLNSN